ncbi:hypothetical protein [Methylobacterium planeticum]|uniref:hypothetical protein n=1 Tax=Methylobacterium planeticum TaxID=2615211 RepID=UPI0017839B9E|nr:hypothetical protein [Methylobacterium planeticum]
MSKRASSKLENTRLREAARPFSACVFDDNRDVSISTSNLMKHDRIRLDRAVSGLPE